MIIQESNSIKLVKKRRLNHMLFRVRAARKPDSIFRHILRMFRHILFWMSESQW